MSGQSIVDRLNAAKHTVAGSALGKAVVKATTEEIIAPKRKHLEYLLACTSEMNVSIPQMADLLIERAQNSSWVVTFKALITIHNLMCYGNERFSQYMASHSSKFLLNNFIDKSGVQGVDMSSYIRKYANYLNEKRETYKLMGFDFCKVKRGKDDGMLRTMNADKLLKTAPILHQQLEALLSFDVQPNELTNAVISSCFVLLSKDLIRLFACYNDGIINLLEKFFDMNKKNAKEALEIYKKFLERTDQVSAFLKVAESAGMEKGDIPDLAKAPSSLLEALESHLATLENKKTTNGGTAASTNTKPPSSVTNAINSLSSNTTLTTEETRKVIEEEAKTLEAYKSHHLKKQSSLTHNEATNSPSKNGGDDIFSLDFNKVNNTNITNHTNNNNNRPSDDLLMLNGANPFIQNLVNNVYQQPQQQNANNSNPFQQQTNFFQQTQAQTSFPINSNPMLINSNLNNQKLAGYYPNNNFVNNNSNVNFNANVLDTSPPEFDAFGDVLQPTSNNSILKPQNQQNNNLNGNENKQPTAAEQKLLSTDLESSLASLADNLDINYKNKNLQKNNHQWTPGQQQGQVKTGGNNWKPMQSTGPVIQSATTAPLNTISPIQQQQPMWSGMGGQQQQPNWNLNQNTNNPFALPQQQQPMMAQPMFNMGQQQIRNTLPTQMKPTISSNSNNPFGF